MGIFKRIELSVAFFIVILLLLAGFLVYSSGVEKVGFLGELILAFFIVLLFYIMMISLFLENLILKQTSTLRKEIQELKKILSRDTIEK